MKLNMIMTQHTDGELDNSVDKGVYNHQWQNIVLSHDNTGVKDVTYSSNDNNRQPEAYNTLLGKRVEKETTPAHYTRLQNKCHWLHYKITETLGYIFADNFGLGKCNTS